MTNRTRNSKNEVPGPTTRQTETRPGSVGVRRAVRLAVLALSLLALSPAPAEAAEQIFSMAAWGGGSTVELRVHNPGSSTAAVAITHYHQDGTLAQRQSLDVGPGATSVVRKAGTDGALQPGWIHVSSTVVVMTREMFDLSVGGRKLPAIGVLPAVPSRRITLFGYRASGVDTGIAIANPGASGPVTIQIRARAANGSSIAVAPMVLPARGARSLYISELFPDLPDSFEGVVEVESPTQVAALTLLQDASANLTTVGALAWREGQAEVGSCESIQEAIDALPEAGGRVLIPAGRYPCKTAVTVNRDNVSLLGEGAATVLELDPGANSPLLVLGDTKTPPAVRRHGINVSGLTLVGNRQQQVYECWGGPCDSGGLSSIRNNGITLRQVEDSSVEQVSVRGFRSGGIVAEKESRRLLIHSVDASDNQWDGVAAYETTDSVLSEISSHDNLAAGLSLDIDFAGNTVSNVTIADNHKVGIFMRDSRANIFQGVQISRCGEHGVFLAETPGTASSAATGNTFLGVHVENCAGAAVRVNDASCVDNQFIGCRFSGNSGGCISEAPPGLVMRSSVICR